MSSKKDIRRVLVIYKTSPYDRYDELGVLGAQASAETAPVNAQERILARLERAHLANQRSISEVQDVLHRSGLEVTERQQPTKREAASVDLVITVGGDGTFLATAQRVSNALMLGVNSAPATSVGHYCATHASDFGDYLETVLSGNAEHVALDRIDCRVGNRTLPYRALNDILFAHRSPASSTRYLLEVDGDAEIHTSSGIWIATASGSSGAMRSAGGERMTTGQGELQYLVREPYTRQGMHVKLRQGRTRETITALARNHKLQVFMDGHLRAPSIGFGTRVAFSVSPHALKVIGYPH